MNCHRHGERLSALADDELHERDAAWLQAHMDECPECRAELRLVRLIKQTIRAHARCVDPPEGFWLGVRARMTQMDRAARRASHPTLFLPPAAAVAGIVLLTLVVATVIWQSQQRPLPVQAVLFAPPSSDLPVGYVPPAAAPMLSFQPRVARMLPQSGAQLVGVYPRQVQGQDVASIVYDLEGMPIVLHESVGPGFAHPSLEPVQYRGRLYNHGMADSQNLLTWANEPLKYLMHGRTPLDRLLLAADDVP
jgi:hypothetical protein